MHRESGKPRGRPPKPARPAPPQPQAPFELRMRPSGRWAVFGGGTYVCSTGTRDRRLAAIRLRMAERQNARQIH
jgi:hypothetical protein